MLHAASREKPQNSRRILSVWPDADVLSQIGPKAAILFSVRDSSARHQLDFFSRP